MQILATFPSRNVADSVKDALMEQGINAADLIVMVNRESAEPPEDARLEVGAEGEEGFGGFEEKIGKAVNSLLGKHTHLAGDGTEGQGKGGAILGVTVHSDAEAARVREYLKLQQASDIEIAQPD